VTALQNSTAGRLLTGLFWALGAVCGTALTTILARVVAPEAGLWGAILCAILAAIILRDVTPKASAITPPSAPAIDKGHLSLTHDLNSAFDNQEIRPHFQPQVSLKDGQITGMEALARWHHPAHGMVAPLAFSSSVAQAQLWHT
jgi:sensor c-di-GMP phosphodiesterase-like protein